VSNYDLQDDSGDQSIDTIVPDLPFDTSSFVISTTDTNPPSIANVSVIDQNNMENVFTEDITQASSETFSNYVLSPTLTINSSIYNNTSLTVTIIHSPLIEGNAYNVTVNNLEDLSDNIQTEAFVNSYLFYNATSTGLIFTEIMYTAPSEYSNALEFLEIYNNGMPTIALGGITLNDEGNFTFTFPEQSLASSEIVVLATAKTSADAFYSVTFLEMPQGISNA
jgi:hypothetical protein